MYAFIIIVCDPVTNEPCLKRSENALCIYNPATSYTCGCQPGYEGDLCEGEPIATSRFKICLLCINLKDETVFKIGNLY